MGRNVKARAARYLKAVGGAEALRAMGNGNGVDLDALAGKERAKPQQREHIEQKAVMQWAQHREEMIPELKNLFAVPNGGARHIVVAKRMKAEGVKRGVPDLFLAIPRKPFHGLFLEMKVDGNKTSAQQDDWILRLRAAGYRVEVCYGRGPAIEHLIDYLQIPERWRY